MRAAVVHDFRQPLRIEEVPIPEPGLGEDVVKVETSGLCHTDIQAATGTGRSSPCRRSSPATSRLAWPSRSGPEVRGVTEGDRGSRPVAGRRVRNVRLLRLGARDTLPQPGDEWLHRRRGWEGYVKANASLRRARPRWHRSPRRRPADCAGVTPYEAVKVSGVRSSYLAGASMADVDLIDTKLDMAAKLGAEHTFNAKDEARPLACPAVGTSRAS